MKLKLILLVLILFISSPDGIPCTIFYFVQDGKMYFCNNEDWSDPDTEIRFYPSRKGQYAWVYLGFSNNWAQGGVNEKGLCWDWVAGYQVDDWKSDKSKKTFRGNLSAEMVKRCSTVEEAIQFIKDYNEVSFSYARMMIGDNEGNSAILGWKNGQLDVQRNEGSLQAFGYKGKVVRECFADAKSGRDIDFLAETLDNAHQEGRYPTQYSNIIAISEGKIYLYKDHQYDKYLEIDYQDKLSGAYAAYKISDLFNNPEELSGIKLVHSP